jgi:hypothetical protein
MPPLPSAARVIKNRFVGTNGGYPWNCIMHTQYAGSPPTSTDLATYGNALATLWNTNVAPLCATPVSLTSMELVDLSSVTSPSAVVTVSHPGTRVGQGFTAQVALVSSWHANIRYRGGHPRNYWPGGVVTDLSDPSLWSPASRAAFASAFEAFRAGINGTPVAGGTAVLVLVSYRTAHAVRPTPLVTNITSVTVHPRLDSQRRRLGKERP